MVQFNFLKSYQDTILSIIEDKPRFEIPKIIFKFIILISFMQILLYLFSDFKMVSVDENKLKSLFYICEMVSIVNILNLKRSDSLSLIVFLIAQMLMFLYFAYVAMLTICKEYLKEFYAQNQQTFVKINELLNIYFTFYLNVFLSQYIELNCSLLFCGQKSILSSQYSQYLASGPECIVPTWQLIISIIGISLAILTAFITSYYFRNYEFLEKNILKRKSTILFQFLIAIRIVIPFIDFNGSLSGAKQVKHILSQIYGCVSIIDYFLSIPFTDQEISKFYLVIIAYYEGIVTCSNLFLLGGKINGQEMFYMCILSTLVLSVTLQSALNYKYESMLKGNWALEQIIPNLDYYLEQIVLLGEKSSYSEEAKILIQKIFKLHRNGCKIENCICHQYPCLNMKIMNDFSTNQKQEAIKETTDKEISHLIQNEINMRLIYKFIDSIFQWMFSQKCLSQSTQEFEKLSLKYISFMMKYQNNQVRAYYELKILQLKKSSFSIYFKMIANIISQKIQENIECLTDQGESQSLKSFGTQKKYNKISKFNRTVKNELTVQSIVDVEQICAKYIPLFLEVIDCKHDLWVKLQNGYKCMNDFQVDAIKLMKKLNLVKNLYLREMRKMKLMNPDIENSLQFQKLTQIFYLFVVNDTIKSIQIETQIIELKKRDTLAELDQLKNVSMIKGDICVLEISLSENLGKIVSKKDEKAASFFGFSQKQDFMKINHINDLMPNFIGRAHNDLMKNFIQGQSIRSKTQNTTLYSHIKLNDGYIFPVKIQFDYSFLTSSQDFRMNGIILKNRAEQDYIIFHRNGRIVGMTKHVAKILFQEFNKLPNGIVAIQRLNALLMFPKIVKKIIKNRDLIIQDLTEKNILDQQLLGDTNTALGNKSKSACTMTTLIEDSRGSMKFSSNPYSTQRKFINYLNKKIQLSQGSLKNSYRYEDIDLLDKSSLKLLKQYEDQNLGQSTNRSHHDSSERLLSGKGAQARDLEDINLFNNTRIIQTINTQNSQQLSQMEYKMKFEYQLQYCLLNQKTQQIQMKQKSKSISNQFTMNTKQNENKDQLQDIYFQVRIENITTKYRPKKIRYKALEAFQRNIIKYLKSTTSMLSLINHLEKIPLLKNVNNSNMDTTDEIKMSSQENNKLSNESSQIIEQLAPPMSSIARDDFVNIPKKMLRLLQSQQMVSALEDDQLDQKINYEKDENMERKNDSSFKSSNTSQMDESDAFSEDIDFDKVYNQVTIQINTNKQSKESQDSHNSQLENLVNNFCLQKSQLTQIDPNYQVKKILQKRTLCFSFSKAFEIAFTECALNLEFERRDSKCNNKENVLNFEKIKKEDIQTPVTFRQQTDNSILDISFDRIPVKNLAILDSNTQREGKKMFMQDLKSQNCLSQQITDNNLDQTQRSEFKNVQENQAQAQQNIFEISKFQGFDTSVDIFQKQAEQREKVQNQSYLDISARPILDQSNSQMQESNIKQRLSMLDESQLNHSRQISFQQAETALDQKGRTDSKEQAGYSIKINEQNEKLYNVSNQQMNQQMNINSMNNSSQKEENEDIEDSNNIAQDQAVARILNQKGMITGKNSLQRASVNSSTRTSSSYAGVFLKEILIKQKIPKPGLQYKFLLILFLVAFLSLDITNLVIIQNDMQRFSNNVAILRQPRKLLRSFGKVLFGYYLSLEIQLGYLIDDNGSIQSACTNYINSSIKEYKNISETYNIQLMQVQQQLVEQTGTEVFTYSVYVKRMQYFQNISAALQFSSQEQFVYQMNQTFEDQIRIDSFLYLRQNYFDFSSQVLDTVNFLVNDTVSSVNSLTNKFYAVIICAIFSIIFVAIISIPLLKQINFYEEKIMMIVTRINFDQSEMEKAKLQVCKQLVNVDYIDWLNYNYFDIFNMQAKQNKDLNQSQSSKHQSQQNQLSLFSSKNKMQSADNVKQAKRQLQVSGGQLIETSNFQMNSTAQMGKSFFSSQPKIKNQLHMTRFNQQKQIIQNKNMNNNQGKQLNGSSNKFGSSNNYTLQSKIGIQNLRIFDRFLTLFVLTTLNTIFFLIIIIYLSQSNDSLKVPVQMNQRSINLHVIMVNLKIATELLSFDYYIRDNLWPDYQVTNLKKYFDQINISLNTLNTIQQQNTDIIYGTNPFPSSVVNSLKDLQEGRGCNYLKTYPCKDSTNELGIINIISQKNKFVQEYPEVLDPSKPPLSQLVVFLNGQPHLESFVFSFQSEDELFDIYSSTINSSISTVSLSIQNFLQNFLIYGGILFGIIIFLTIIIHWNLQFIKIQEMNLLLTIIPEDKLQEEVTLHMIRQLHRM